MSTIRDELAEIKHGSGYALSDRGHDLQPVKREMLLMPAESADLVLTVCDLLFTASLNYEDAQFRLEAARDAITLAQARMQAAEARAVVTALFHGPTALAAVAACRAAPIPFSKLAAVAPDLEIIDCCRKTSARANSPMHRS